ncbi:hypothetical protein BH20PSE1_BH20PSE1_16920 [soil metagenome]
MTPSVGPARADVWPFSDIDTKNAAVDDRLHRQRAVRPDRGFDGPKRCDALHLYRFGFVIRGKLW